jgi:hypothetical protein
MFGMKAANLEHSIEGSIANGLRSPAAGDQE